MDDKTFPPAVSPYHRVLAGIPCGIRFQMSLSVPVWVCPLLASCCFFLAVLPLSAAAPSKPRSSVDANDANEPPVDEVFRASLILADQQVRGILADTPPKDELARRRDAIDKLNRLMTKRLAGQRPIHRPLTKGQEHSDIWKACSALNAAGGSRKAVRKTMFPRLAGWMLQGKKMLAAGNKERERARRVFGAIVEVLVGYLDDGEAATAVAKAFLLQCIPRQGDVECLDDSIRETLTCYSLAFISGKDTNGQIITAILSIQLASSINCRDSARIDLVVMCMKHRCWAEALILVKQVGTKGRLERIWELKPDLEIKIAEADKVAPTKQAVKARRLLTELKEI